jgi:hypothetical protein
MTEKYLGSAQSVGRPANDRSLRLPKREGAILASHRADTCHPLRRTSGTIRQANLRSAYWRSSTRVTAPEPQTCEAFQPLTSVVSTSRLSSPAPLAASISALRAGSASTCSPATSGTIAKAERFNCALRPPWPVDRRTAISALSTASPSGVGVPYGDSRDQERASGRELLHQRDPQDLLLRVCLDQHDIAPTCCRGRRNRLVGVNRRRARHHRKRAPTGLRAEYSADENLPASVAECMSSPTITTATRSRSRGRRNGSALCPTNSSPTRQSPTAWSIMRS